MKDIARECKVSVATVSIALSGSAKKGRISESKLEEIRQTARRLNYFPNSSASNLARGRSQTIGVVINDIRNSHIAELDTAISEVLQERGYSVVNHIFNDKNALESFNKKCGLIWFVSGLVTFIITATALLINKSNILNAITFLDTSNVSVIMLEIEFAIVVMVFISVEFAFKKSFLKR